jgi:S-adenosylmethionine decarboxylase proenzyme
MTKLSLGKHILVDYYGCNNLVVDDLNLVKSYLLEAARIAKATILTDVFHRFSPQGVSGVVVIGESHLAIHTWPEFEVASIDIFTCSDKMKPFEAIDYLFKSFQAKNYDFQEIKRGHITAPNKRQA